MQTCVYNAHIVFFFDLHLIIFKVYITWGQNTSSSVSSPNAPAEHIKQALWNRGWTLKEIYELIDEATAGHVIIALVFQKIRIWFYECQ